MRCPYCDHSIIILDINAVAKLRGVKNRTAILWCKSGNLKATKFGNKWLILKADLDEFQPNPVGAPPKYSR